MKSVYSKPLPIVDERSRPFWEAARRHQLIWPRCDACHGYLTHFEPWCTCGHREISWIPLSGRGQVWSFCRFHRSYFAGMEDAVPYNVALVELEEGPKLITNILGVDDSAIEVGMPVEVQFDDVTDDVSLVKFKPVSL